MTPNISSGFDRAAPRPGALRAALALVLLAALACSSGAGPATPTPPPPAPSPAGPPEVRLGLATVDLGVGPNRFAFGILGPDSSPIRVPTARATFMYIDSTPYEARAQAQANFVTWPAGRAGVYVVNPVELDKAGRWGLVVEVQTQDGVTRVGQLGFDVQLTSSSPAVGSLAPRSLNKTNDDVDDLIEITTSTQPDPDLYRLTIADAIDSGKPAVVTFATPAFCKTATCGPQVEVVSAIQDRRADQANFIHVEVYDNPLEIGGDLSKARISPIVQEWGLISEPYTFIIDGQGVIKSKFEGFVTDQELEAALQEILG